jgi:hypothetical protein
VVGRFRQDDFDGGRLRRPIAVPSEEHSAMFPAAEIAVQSELVVQDAAFPVFPGRDSSGAEALGSIEAANSLLRMPDQGAMLPNVTVFHAFSGVQQPQTSLGNDPASRGGNCRPSARPLRSSASDPNLEELSLLSPPVQI